MRLEYKYLINKRMFELLKNELSLVMTLDPNTPSQGFYNVRSIYFDSANHKDYYSGLYGLCHKEKYRIRFYNLDPTHIIFEKKEKFNQKSRKYSSHLSLYHYKELLKGNHSIINQNNSIKTNVYSTFQSMNYRPKIVVSYNRVAYVLPYNNIRVTLDYDTSYTSIQQGLFQKNLGFYSIDSEYKYILEIKFNNFLPNHIKNTLQRYINHRLSISKYVLCMQRQSNRI